MVNLQQGIYGLHYRTHVGFKRCTMKRIQARTFGLNYGKSKGKRPNLYELAQMQTNYDAGRDFLHLQRTIEIRPSASVICCGYENGSQQRGQRQLSIHHFQQLPPAGPR